MARTTKIVQIFSAGCPACDQAIQLVHATACSECKVEVLDMKDEGVAKRARALGVHRVPAVVVDGKLAGCCVGQCVTEAGLRAAGVGTPV